MLVLFRRTSFWDTFYALYFSQLYIHPSALVHKTNHHPPADQIQFLVKAPPFCTAYFGCIKYKFISPLHIKYKINVSQNVTNLYKNFLTKLTI